MKKLYPHALRMRLAARALLVCLSLLGAFPAQSSVKENRLTVRLLDPRNGKPLARVSVGILVWQQGRTIDLGNAVTDAKGVAIFLLPSAIPERIGISHSPTELRWCSDEGFPTDKILKTGMVAECKCDKVKLKTNPTAAGGELVLFAIRFTLWERVLREIP